MKEIRGFVNVRKVKVGDEKKTRREMDAFIYLFGGFFHPDPLGLILRRGSMLSGDCID